jgi:uncharacterized protein YjiS (DUF1127 family)
LLPASDGTLPGPAFPHYRAGAEISAGSILDKAMTMKTDISHHPRPGRATLSSLVHNGLWRVAHGARRWQQQSAELRQLEQLLQMEDYVLRDVGISRDAIRAELAALRPGLRASLMPGLRPGLRPES